MKIDLAAVAGQLKAAKGKVRALWSGGQIEVDENELIERVADAYATVMGQNIFKGLRPDGSGPMPGRKKDGKPRGATSAISRALASRAVGAQQWLIAAHKEIQGHLARILQEVPFVPPPIETIGPAIHRAFDRAIRMGARAAASGLTSTAFDDLFRGSKRNWYGGKRVKLGTMFRGIGDTSAFEGMGGLRFGRQLRGPRKVSTFGRALRGPRRAR